MRNQLVRSGTLAWRGSGMQADLSPVAVAAATRTLWVPRCVRATFAGAVESDAFRHDGSPRASWRSRVV